MLCTIYIYFKNEFSLHDNIDNEKNEGTKS